MNTANSSPTLTRAALGIEPGLPLEASTGGVDELRRDIQRLFDIEAIKQVKHAYFRCLDTVNFDELKTLFHEDFRAHFIGGTYEWKIETRDEYMSTLRKSLNRESLGQHNGHHPEIQILSETEATGLWYLADKTWILGAKYLARGTAIYRDRYVKVGGRWVIKETTYRRIFEENIQLDEAPQLSAHYMGEFGPAPAA